MPSIGIGIGLPIRRVQNTISVSPENLVLTVIDTETIKLDWEYTGDGIEGFIIERAILGEQYSEVIRVDANTLTYTNTDLVSNTTYVFRILAYNGNRRSDYSNVAIESTAQVDSPTNFYVINVEGGVKLTWTDVPNTIGDVEIYASIDGGDFEKIADVNYGVQEYTHIITGDNLITYIIRQEIVAEPFQTEYQTLYDLFSTKPSEEDAIVQNALIKKLKNDNVWNNISGLWLFCLHTNTNGESLYNVRYPNKDKAVINDAPVFTAFKEIKGDGSNDYVNLKWNPTDDGVVFSQDSASFIVAAQDTGSKGYLFGVKESMYMLMLYTSQGVLNSAYNTTGANPGRGKRYASMIRQSSSLVTRYLNKEVGTDEAVTSTGINTKDINLLASNSSANTPNDFGDGAISALVIGNFNETQKNLIIDALEQYLDNYGYGIL